MTSAVAAYGVPSLRAHCPLVRITDTPDVRPRSRNATARSGGVPVSVNPWGGEPVVWCRSVGFPARVSRV